MPQSHSLGNRHIHNVTNKHTTAIPAPAHQRSGKRYSIHTHEQAIISADNTLPFNGMARLRSQLRTIGPKWRCSLSQRWKRGDVRDQQPAASSTNGTVGNPGKKMPIIPKISASQPASHTKGRHSGR